MQEMLVPVQCYYYKLSGMTKLLWLESDVLTNIAGWHVLIKESAAGSRTRHALAEEVMRTETWCRGTCPAVPNPGKGPALQYSIKNVDICLKALGKWSIGSIIALKLSSMPFNDISINQSCRGGGAYTHRMGADSNRSRLSLKSDEAVR